MSIQTPLGAVTTENHGRFWRASIGARQFSGGNQAPAAAALTAITPGTTTTYAGGLILYNPVASTANLSINFASFAFVLAQTNPALISLGVGQSATAITTPGTAVGSQIALVGSSVTPQGVLYSPTSATLPVAPYLLRQLGVVGTSAETVIAGDSVSVDLGGSIVLEPGAYCCFISSAAGTASSFVGSFTWEETPLGATV